MSAPKDAKNRQLTRQQYKNRRKLIPLDEITPSERERLYFKLYLELGKVNEAFDELRRREGKPISPTRLKWSASIFNQRPGVKRLRRDYDNQVALRTQAVLEKYAVSEDRVLEELVKIAFTNVTDHTEWDENGVRVKSSNELSPETKAAIEEVVEYQGENGIKKIKIKNISKAKALELLARKLGMFNEVQRHEHKHLAAVKFIIEKN
jgi:hypothetical protein